MMDGWDMNGWGWGWMVLTMTVSILLVALLVIALLRGSSQGSGPEHRDGPAQILAQRLARGEIDEEEYQRLRSLLRSTDGSPAL